MPNSAPKLTDLVTSLNFLENTVNATPQILDSDVTFSDPDNNFNGGTLTVAGLLADDILSIRNEGSSAGQIGFDSNTGVVSFGGTVIGTASGGVGATLTVTFNASASSGGIDALIQNLTYQDTSNTPTASRTLHITVTDAAGASTLMSPSFAEQTGPANPFNGIDVGNASRPALADLDGDGDLDAVVGNQAGTLSYFLNTGTSSAPLFVQQTGAANPFNGIAVSSWSTPTFADLDGDGDRDLILGENDGRLFYFQNVGSANAPVFVQQIGALNPFNGIDVGELSVPTFGDLDLDGDLDAVVGSISGGLRYFQNTGTISAPVFVEQTGAANPFNGVQVGGDNRVGNASGAFARTAPSLADVDRDGDLDVVAGTSAAGTLQFLQNTGSASSPAFSQQIGANNPFSGINLFVGGNSGFDALPAVADLDGDGKLDVIVGADPGDLRYLKNTTPNGIPITINVTAQNDAPVAVADTLSATEDTAATFTAAQLLGNDTDADNTNAQLAIASVTSGAGGSAVLNGNGSVTFTPNANFNGAADFAYTVTDGTTASAPATVTVNVTAVNDTPVAVADTLSATEDTAATFTAAQLLGNDTDADNTNAQLAIASVTSGAGGSAVLNGNGSVTFTPNANFNGAADFAYTVTDGTTASAPATVTVNVTAVNDASAPTGLDLAAADDTGSSNSDNITRNTSGLTISGSGQNGAIVTLYDDTNNNGLKDGVEATLATMTVTGSTFTTDIALGAGTHHVRAFQTVAGDVSESSTSLDIMVDIAVAAPTNLDLVAADDTGSSSSDNLTRNTSALTITGTGENGATLALFDDANNDGVYNNGEIIAATQTLTGNTFTADISLSQGTHHIRGIQQDLAGNLSGYSTGLDITVDTTPPTSPSSLDLATADDTGSSSTDNVTKNTSALTVNGTGVSGSTVTLFDDTNNNGIKESSDTLLGTAVVTTGGVFSSDITLEAGLHHLKAFQTDLAGNASASSTNLDITVDTAAPVSVITSEGLGNGNSGKLTLTGTAEAGNVISIFDGASLLATTTAANNGTWTYTTSSHPSNALHAYSIKATDVAGNIGSGPNSAFLGTTGSDIFTGTSGNDFFIGNGGSDKFVFNNMLFGKDSVQDFNALAGANHDIIQFDHTVFDSFNIGPNSVMSHASQAGSDVIITLDAQDAIRLVGVNIGTLTQDDFLIV
ncbi:tandem-95 repeat protein [Bradyrhizobium sp. CW9]|uniref:cadherin-like domain-containing protein n=1 Tax=Bradyrhizobium sp. CW9 TaxID=2782689 RepID=UPI001FF7A5A3|nr:cadherin-like domain-containing protein [Bradyrhizobium sp. CW9]MCK1333300.1 tandem-95 repeat protein [Bradyrhizobium sp. CW9]